MPQTVGHQAPLSMGFPRQESWSGLLFPSPGYLPNPGIKPGSPALQTDALPSNVTHLTKHMNQMIQAMDSPEASVTWLWETLTSFPWWESVLIVIILIDVLSLSSLCICDYVTGLVSNHLKVLK